MNTILTLASKLVMWFSFFIPVFITGFSRTVNAYTVSDIAAEYHNGQVFITWKNPAATNLQYNVYGSAAPITQSSQLTAGNFLGFVRDSSGKNYYLSQQQHKSYFFRINDIAPALEKNKGLYVITLQDNQPYYYAVTVTDLSTGKEAKKLTAGKNTLVTPIGGALVKPVPVFQDSILSSGEVKLQYVLYGDNRETPMLPALNSTGSFGFNFYITKRGTAGLYPLVVVFQGGASGNKIGLESSVTNCYILGVDDWLPLPAGTGEHDAQYCCYHEDFNIYSGDNPVPTSGIIKTYPQRRYIEAVRWAKTHLPIDASRVYAKGNSQSGHAALLFAGIFPEEIAAVYAVCEPMSLVTAGQDILEQMWGLKSSALKTDVLNWSTGEPLSFVTLADVRKMVHVNELLDMPLIFDVHGKNDITVNWSDSKIEWMDSLQSNHAGGVFYWDQRSHGGSGKNFLDDETLPDFFRYSTAKSYPAFSNCSINQDPGNGSPSNGDPYGAINGYLDWEDDITDNECDYTIHVFVKDLYVGGVLDPQQYNTCTTDITFRRLQTFQPDNGATVKWKNYDASNTKIQSGSLIFDGGLITIKGMQVNKSGNRIELKITNCQRLEAADDITENEIYFSRTAIGYTAHADLKEDQLTSIRVIDMMGRIVLQESLELHAGVNTFDVADAGEGIFLIEVKGIFFTHVEKLFF